MRRLFESLPADAFIALADEHLPKEGNPFVRGELRFRRALAAGEPRSDQARTQAARALVEFNQQPSDPRWKPVQGYMAERSAQSPVPTLMEDYAARLESSATTDVLIRRLIVERLLSQSPDRLAALAGLRQIVTVDPDPSIRLVATIKLGELCTPGDYDTADLLDELALLEPNELRVRSMMEYVAQVLRTGEEDADRMPTSPP